MASTQPAPEEEARPTPASSDHPHPTSQPPESSEPVVPGPRALRLQQFYARTLAHTLSKISWANFSSCYPTIAASSPDILRAVQKQMVDRLSTLCTKTFNDILEFRNVVPKLNEMEALIADAARRRNEEPDNTPIPPHTLPPETILSAHMAPHLVSQQSQLNARIQTVQARNAALWNEIQAQRQELNALLACLDKAVADVDGATKLLEPVVDDIAKETREVEMELGDGEKWG